MADSLYADGAKIGDAIGHALAGVRRIVVNVRDYLNGIQDGARVASTKGDDDHGDRRDDD